MRVGVVPIAVAGYFTVADGPQDSFPAAIAVSSLAAPAQYLRRRPPCSSRPRCWPRTWICARRFRASAQRRSRRGGTDQDARAYGRHVPAARRRPLARPDANLRYAELVTRSCRPCPRAWWSRRLQRARICARSSKRTNGSTPVRTISARSATGLRREITKHKNPLLVDLDDEESVEQMKDRLTSETG